MKLAVFDFDSTLMNGETIDFIASELNIEKEVSKITELAMSGELDFFDSLIKRVKLLKGIPLKRVKEICENLPLMTGAKETILELQKQNYKVLCFSGGFRDATFPASEKLGINGDFANILHSKNGFLTGKVGGEMMFSSSKGDLIQRLQKILNISIKDTLVVGDGANDLSMFKFAKIKIAFCAKNILKKNATHIINKKDLTLILSKII